VSAPLPAVPAAVPQNPPAGPAFSAAERGAMREALALAASGLGTTSPNPSVGCVLLDAHGAVVGRGRTAPPGGPHAEVRALAEAGAAARGATAVVTLEPCDHTGRTGPCSEALLAAGVSRLVYALPDPHALAAGGAQRLAAAGVDVAGGLLADGATDLLAPWLHRLRTGRPAVTWKVATTVDGRTAAADGSSRWITGEAARADAHRLRGEHDALLVGVGTVLADDPALTVRGTPEPRNPLRIVLDAAGRTPAGARVRSGEAPTWIVTGDRTRDLPGLLAELGERGVVSLWVEGGARVAGAFWDAGLVDRVVAYVAPAFLGAGPPPAAAVRTGASMADIVRLHWTDVARVGEDVRLIGIPVRDDRAPAAAAAKEG
jgi:diaminohydroxyphosphoribosylaminopyrimidine deaminase/5-amino-6-(5-phosphoribosylamino)uracil reductase